MDIFNIVMIKNLEFQSYITKIPSYDSVKLIFLKRSLDCFVHARIRRDKKSLKLSKNNNLSGFF